MRIATYEADVDGKTTTCAKIYYESDEELPTGYGAGSMAYCYKGDDKGKLSVYDGESWEEQ